METLSIETEDLTPDEIDQLTKNGVDVVKSNSFIGHEAIVEIILPITALAIISIRSIIIEKIRAKKYISIKKNGIEITGVEPEELLKAIKQQDNERSDGNS